MILKRGDRFAVRVQYEGTRRWVGTFDSKRDARVAEREAQARLEQDVERGEQPLTLDEFVAFWLEGYRDRVKESSYRTARQNLRKFAEDFKGRLPGSIEPLEAERWARANKHRVRSVSTVMNDLERKGLAGPNPFHGLGGKGRGRKDMVPLTREEVHTLADCALEGLKEWGPMFRALVLFAAYTGFRAGELYALEWRDIDFAGRRVWLRRQVYRGGVSTLKTGEPERFLPEQAADALVGLARHGDLVFRSKKERPLHVTPVTLAWDQVETLFGRRVTMHHLRHAAGFHMYVTLGLPARVVAVQLGHDGPDMVQNLYGHGNVGALAALEAGFGRKPTAVQGLRVAGGVADAV